MKQTKHKCIPTESQEQAIAERYRKGLGQRELADRYGLVMRQIADILKRHKVVLRIGPKYTPTPEEIAEATSKIQDGWSKTEERQRAGRPDNHVELLHVQMGTHRRNGQIQVAYNDKG